MKQPISITALASISALGSEPSELLRGYRDHAPEFATMTVGGQALPIAALPTALHAEIDKLRQSDAKYRALDDSVLYAMAVSRAAVQQAGWTSESHFGINIGSSRGATGLFEKYHEQFLETGKTSTLASPVTTLGNIASWVAHDLQTDGPEISHSITCSTALHALLNGYAWLQAGLCDKFLVGGSEAPLTPFTLAQMQAMKIYAKAAPVLPCRALDLEKKHNSMILGEGAAVTCLETGIPSHALAVISGVGYATELLEHNVSISTEADCFQKSMRKALGTTPPNEVDVIVMHAPGTVKGDLSEFRAIQRVFGETLPLLTTTKWRTGHTFGASGMLSVELALLMLAQGDFIGTPFADVPKKHQPIKTVLVNAVGFGGNAVSVLLRKP